MFFLYGETTRNGKGTLMESILRVMGDYGRAVRPETIAQKQNVNSQNPSEDIARIGGIRFANISEPSRGLVLNAAQVKSMTGNDTKSGIAAGNTIRSISYVPPIVKSRAAAVLIRYGMWWSRRRSLTASAR
jgi:hypothetical protein